MSATRRGIMLVVSSPSGAGKTTLTRNLLSQEKDISLSVSVTTRERRHSEIEGVHYHFISVPEFESLRDAGGLLEWAEVHGNCYGTPREPVERSLATGHDMLFDIDWQGTRQLYRAMRQDIVSVFVLPPSAAELKTRLERRAEDSAETIARRLRNAIEEIAHWNEYDHVLVNDDLDRSFAALREILADGRRRSTQRADMNAFVAKLLAELREIAV
jgi:guanylate kinase